MIARSNDSSTGRPTRRSRKRVGHEPPELPDESVGALDLGTTSLDEFVVVDAVAEPGVPIVAVLAWLAERLSGVSYCEHDLLTATHSSGWALLLGPQSRRSWHLTRNSEPTG